MKYLWIILLAGCSSGPVVPETVRVPVPVPCIERVPAKPQITPDATLLALPDYSAVLSLWRDRIILRDYSVELEAAVAGCL